MTDKIIKVGVLLEYGESLHKGKSLEGSIDLALSYIKQQYRYLYGYNLSYVAADSGCDPITTVGALGRMIFIDKIHVVIGPSCQLGCVSASYMAASHDIPLISHGCAGYELSNKTIYPTFSRSRPFARQSVNMTAQLLTEFIIKMGWSRIGLLHQDDSMWVPFAKDLLDVIGKKGIEILEDDVFDADEVDLESVIQAFKEKARVIILAGDFKGLQRILEYMDTLQMFNGDYAIITIDLFDHAAEERSTWDSLFSLGTYDGLIDIGVPGFDMDSPKLRPFNNQLRQRLIQPPFYYQAIEPIYSLTPYAYDAILLYANGLREAIEAQYMMYLTGFINSTLTSLLANETFYNTTPYLNDTVRLVELHVLPRLNMSFINSTFAIEEQILRGRNITQQMFNMQFEGLAGNVTMDANGDRKPLKLQIKKMVSNGQPIAFVDYHTETERYIQIENPYFPGGTSSPPPDKPTCGFKNDECPAEESFDTTAVAIGLTAPFAFIALMCIVYFIYKRQKYEADLLDSRYYIKYKDLIPYRYTGKSRPGVDSLENSLNVQKTLNDGSFNKKMLSMSELGFTKVVITVARKFIAKYKMDKVFVRKLGKPSLHVNREILVEMKEVRDLVSLNVNRVVGVCIEPPNICIVECYCSKGSLQDVLMDDEITLDYQFRTSFAYDIAAGMLDLHESKIAVHGNLSSSTVLVDSRWMCKITDYGLHKFKDITDTKPKQMPGEHRFTYRELLWRAPELISLAMQKSSKAGDTYSYGIILSEIVTRLEPFKSYGYEHKDILHFVQKRCIPPFRPYVRLESGIDGRLLDLMRKCWSEEPQERPSFSEIKQQVKSIKKPGTERNEAHNWLDNTITMMEKYSANLEKTVTDRTDMLAKEKDKVETVLHKLVPKKIGDKLKHGDYVVPESIDSMSVMITDIIGFSTFTSESTPLQVVELLNDFYAYFDSTIQSYECFKIETEGEKCMVTSGVPMGSGKNHLDDVSVMALKLLSKLATAQIRHLKTDILMLRIALHTGPCVAGVVGAKAPRYCVFGDTVTHARHVQHTGPPLRIQITPQFRYGLLEKGGYEMMERGAVDIKGKGMVRTYFLLGKDGCDYPLPEPVEDLLFRKNMEQDGTHANRDWSSSAALPQRSTLNDANNESRANTV